uniref:F-box domain-containing protein n=1 Tax=Glossina pallidipes TaxID=7398 RepID=A0A1A9ZVK8_GLOPL
MASTLIPQRVYQPTQINACPCNSAFIADAYVSISCIKKTMDTLCDVRDDEDAKAPELPNELWVNIFNHLSHGDLLGTRVVCKHWYQLVSTSELKRKSILVITQKNLKDIINLIVYKDLKYERLEINGKWDTFSSEEQEFLIKIFKTLESDITHLRLCGSTFLPLLNNPLPKLTELDLSRMQPWDNFPIDFNKFLNVKSILMPLFRSHRLLSQLTWTLIKIPKICLERLSLNITPSPFPPVEGFLLATHASTLRWLKFGLSRPLREVELYMQDVFKTFTKLEALDITGVRDDYKRTVLQHLPEQNPLKVIALRIYSHDYDLLELIQRKWSKSLVRIDLTCHMSGNVATPFNFTSSKIRCLRLLGDEMAPEYLLDCIAPTTNKTLTVLKLHIPIPAGHLFGDLLQRLPYLIDLDLRGTQSTITDEEMNCIFRYLIHLRQLALGRCIHDNNDFPYSTDNISNLKCLQKLMSCFCPIKILQILNLNFKFIELKYLHIEPCERSSDLSVPIFLDIYKTYFPALERLSSPELDFASKSVEEMRKSFPRIRRYDLHV